MATRHLTAPTRAAPAPADVGTTEQRPPPDDGELARARQRAGLRPCPAPAPGVTAPSGPLAGVPALCLGAPGTVDLAAALAGRSALLNVWASWCGPCREEIPVLAAYSEQPGSIPVIGINVQDSSENALALLADLGARYTSVVDTDGTLRAALHAPPVLPISYLLHPDGSVQRITSPAVFRTTDEIRQAVAKHLNRAADQPAPTAPRCPHAGRDGSGRHAAARAPSPGTPTPSRLRSASE